MRFFVIALVLLAIGWGVHQLLEPVPITTTTVLTPQERFHQVFAKHPVPAGELVVLCDSYPDLATQLMKNRPVQITGTVLDLRISGLGGRRVGIELSHGSVRRLLLVYDLDHYGVLGLSPVKNKGWHFLVVGTELLLVDPSRHRRAVVAALQYPLTSHSVFERLTPTFVLLGSQLPLPWQHD